MPSDEERIKLTKRIDEIGSVHTAAIEDLRKEQDKLWDAANQILEKLAKIK